jgi:hypothetical protein
MEDMAEGSPAVDLLLAIQDLANIHHPAVVWGLMAGRDT